MVVGVAFSHELISETDYESILLYLGYDQTATVSIPNLKVPDSIKFSFSIEEVKERGEKYVPYTYYSLYEKDNSNSFRLFVSQPGETQGLIAGAAYFKDGKNVFQKALITDIPFYS